MTNKQWGTLLAGLEAASVGVLENMKKQNEEAKIDPNKKIDLDNLIFDFVYGGAGGVLGSLLADKYSKPINLEKIESWHIQSGDNLQYYSKFTAKTIATGYNAIAKKNIKKLN